LGNGHNCRHHHSRVRSRCVGHSQLIAIRTLRWEQKLYGKLSPFGRILRRRDKADWGNKGNVSFLVQRQC
jgi:hypothetical protein